MSDTLAVSVFLFLLTIFVKHLVGVRVFAVNPLARKMLLTEMIARVLKNEINNSLRQVMKNTQLPLKVPFSFAITNFFNQLIGWGNNQQMEESTNFWKITCKKLLLEKFLFPLTNEEYDVSYDLRLNIYHVHLFYQLEKLTAITFNQRIFDELKTSNSLLDLHMELSSTDIVTIGAKVKHLNIIDLAEAKVLTFEAINSQSNQSLWNQIYNKFSSAMEGNTLSWNTLLNWSVALFEQALQQLNVEQAIDLLILAQSKIEKAVSFFHCAWDSQGIDSFIVYQIEFAPDSDECWFVCANICLENACKLEIQSSKQQKTFKHAIELYTKSIQMNPSFFEKLLQKARDKFNSATNGSIALSEMFVLPSFPIHLC